MGVVVGARVFDLVLPERPEYVDIKVSARGLTVGEALDYAEFMDGLAFLAPVIRDLAEVEKRDRAYELFATRVVEWNLEVRVGVPLPKTLDGMRALDWRMAKDLIGAWVRAVAEVPDPLEERSTGGEPSPEESIPMEPWLESPGNLPAPEPS